MSKQRIPVTGGAGFIGSELVRQLVARGFDILIVDNLVNGKRENLKGVLSKNVELVVTDIRDQRSMNRCFGAWPSFFISLVSAYGTPSTHPWKTKRSMRQVRWGC